jgi:hypothetical protein
LIDAPPVWTPSLFERRIQAVRELRLAALVFVCISVFGCNTVQNAAAQDPMKCERDPKCATHAEKSRDCVTVCVDDPACIDRCRQVSGQGAYTR